MQPPQQAIVMGASAGAVETLTYLLPLLPQDYPLPVLIVIHLPANRKSVMVELLQPRCKLKIKEAEDKEDILGGTVYFAPPDYHMLIESDKKISLSTEEPVLFSRPSIDVLFETASDAYGPGLTGVILSGANNDGANGLKCVIDAGGRALVQRPETAYVGVMPQAALTMCPAALPLGLEEISAYLQKEALS